LAAAHTRSSSEIFSRCTNATGPRRGSPARPVGESESVRKTRDRLRRTRQQHTEEEESFSSTRPPRGERQARRESSTPRGRTSTKRRKSSTQSGSSTPKKEREPPLFVPFITRVCKCPGSKGPVGGATLAHWSGEKEACISPDPDIAHAGRPCSLKLKALDGDSAALSAWCCSRRKKKSRRWSAGVERWRRYDAGEGVRWRRCCDVGEGVIWRRCCDVAGVVERWWNGG